MQCKIDPATCFLWLIALALNTLVWALVFLLVRGV